MQVEKMNASNKSEKQSTLDSLEFLHEYSLSKEFIIYSHRLAHNWCKKENKYISDSGCYWYHGNWKLLKRLNAVPRPEWHEAFYLASIRECITLGLAQRILICGAADDGMLLLILKAFNDLNCSPNIVMLDICPTPLLLTKTLISSASRSVMFTVANALNLPFPSNSFDLVISDSFLARFNRQETKELSQQWNRVLSPAGRLITTVRVRENFEDCDISKSSFIERLRYSHKTIRKAALYGINPLVALRSSWLFSGKIRSYTYSNEEEIKSVLPGFQVNFQTSEVKEGITKRRYKTIVAQKAEMI